MHRCRSDSTGTTWWRVTSNCHSGRFRCLWSIQGVPGFWLPGRRRRSAKPELRGPEAKRCQEMPYECSDVDHKVPPHLRVQGRPKSKRRAPRTESGSSLRPNHAFFDGAGSSLWPMATHPSEIRCLLRILSPKAVIERLAAKAGAASGCTFLSQNACQGAISAACRPEAVAGWLNAEVQVCLRCLHLLPDTS